MPNIVNFELLKVVFFEVLIEYITWKYFSRAGKFECWSRLHEKRHSALLCSI